MGGYFQLGTCPAQRDHSSLLFCLFFLCLGSFFSPARPFIHPSVVLSFRLTWLVSTATIRGLQQGKITAQGKLLLHGQLYCCTELSKVPSKEFKELQVFLFEQAIIFSEIVGKRTQFIQPVFIYKAHIQVYSGSSLDPDVRLTSELLILSSLFCLFLFLTDEQNVAG